MSKPKTDTKPDKRPKKEYNEHFGWTGDDVLHLEINGEKVSPPKKQ